MEEKKPNHVISIVQKKCPNCRQGNLFTHRSIFPLGKLFDMPTYCNRCGQKYEIEVGFWYGTGYMSYAISVGLIFTFAVLFGIFYGFSYKDNSIFVFLGVMISSLVILQPFIMRYSRVLYIHMFVKYKSSAFKSPEEIKALLASTKSDTDKK